jgi:DNA-directed RNA polymerase beta' subunit
MEQDIREIESITFGIYSTDELLKLSVAEINSTKLTGGPGTVYDDRLGTIENNKICETCKLTAKFCSGHFGHIVLNENIIHPLYYKQVKELLRCFCIKCCRILILKDQILLEGLNKFKKHKRFQRILAKLEKIDECCHCSQPQPEIKFSSTENTMSKVYKQKNNQKMSIILTVDEIKKIFDNITDEDVELLGFDPSLVHPRNYIMSIFPVIPPCCRPYVVADGNYCDDDLTNQILEIIKSNNHLNPELEPQMNESKRQKYVQSLKFRVLTFYNNSCGKAKHTTNGRPIKGLKERITGKEGQIRNNLMGKRACTPKTPVLMFLSGKTKNAEDIVIGDIVVGDDGLPRTVIDTVTGKSKLYKVKQSRGIDYGISCGHILTLKYCEHSQIHWRKNQGKYGGWMMSWYDRKNEVVKSKKINILKNKTKEQAYEQLIILQTNINTDPVFDIHVEKFLSFPNNIKRLMMGVKLSTPIQWSYKDIKLDPRILGMWLGDGGSRGIEFTTVDLELLEYWEKWALKNNCFIKKYNSMHYGVVGNPNNVLTLTLRDYKLINNKHIPEEYIINNEETRLLVLAGLIDTDGSVQGGRTIRITQCNEHEPILNGAERIACSLGFRTSISKKKTTWTCNGERKKGIALTLTISGEGIERIPTLLPRKKCYPPNSKDSSCYKIDIIDDGFGKFCGFEVDQNNRFILGDYTITHNCEQTGRTVIGPDPMLRMGYIGIPKEMVETLTLPVKVTSFNIKKLSALVNNNRANYVFKGKTKFNLKYALFKRGTELMYGDEIHRSGCNVSNIVTGLEKEDKKDRECRIIKVVTGREKLLVGDELKRNGEFFNKYTDVHPIKKDPRAQGEPDNVERKLMVGDIIHRGENNIKVVSGNEKILEDDKVEHEGKIYNNKIVRYPQKKNYTLEIGDVVERKLMDHDWILLNRQPTLHKASMMAFQILIKPYKTIRMNLAVTKPFNADFDGDEMNIHVAQTLEAQTELKMLSATKYNLISAQSSKPNMAVVQDSLLGGYIMTKGIQVITKEQFFNVALEVDLSVEQILNKIQHIRRVLKQLGKKSVCFSGKGLVSLILPEDLIYEKKNNADHKEPFVKIYKGVLYEGTLDKSILGSAHNSLIQILNKEYSPDNATNFIDHIQFIANQWLLISGFSIGIEDCMIPSTSNHLGVSKTQEIEDVIQKCYIEAEGIKTTTTHPGIREMRITASLSKAKDIGMKIAKDSLSKTNNFLDTVHSGSKGDFFNIAQITGLLGQQNLIGQRVPKVLNNGKRTLPHYPFGKLPIELEYESRGFIASSFINGLNPREYYFHAMSGREGICDTAMGTSRSGYIQRRIVKLTEDIKVQYDGSVRDTTGKIYQMAYGENNWDPVNTVKVGKEQEVCDITRMVARLNMKHE